MNIDTNKYYNYRQKMMGKTVDHDSAYGCQCWDGSDNSRRWMACGELNSRGYNTTPYGVFK